jgi:hypothetical protein
MSFTVSPIFTFSASGSAGIEGLFSGVGVAGFVSVSFLDSSGVGVAGLGSYFGGVKLINVCHVFSFAVISPS